MLVMDVPNVDLQVPILTTSLVALAQKSQQPDLTIGVCHLSENPYDATSAVNTMSPALALKNYYYRFGQKASDDFRITIDRLPTHGTLEDIGKGNYAYYPHDGFRGNDRATLMVAMGGKVVKMEYFFRVMQSIPQDYEDGPSPYALSDCPKKVRVWKIAGGVGA